jgi:hypothetical protein
MRNKVCAWVAAVILALGGGFVAPGTALADDAGELPNCQFTVPSIGSAGYNAHGVAVTITIGWQYTAGSWSACEDINVRPASGNEWNLMSPRKARTYMCSLSNPSNCWYNAWRDWPATGGLAATDMANGVKYQVHFAIGGYTGPHVQIYS